MEPRKDVIAGIALLSALLAGWLLWPGGREPAPPEGPSRAAPREPAPRPGHARAPGADAVPPPEEFAPASPTEEAMIEVARITGEGLIRCPAGGLLAEGPVNIPGLERATVKGGALVATVERPQGGVEVPDPSAVDDLFHTVPPVATLTWEGAWPGTAGTCSLTRFSLVELRGVVEDAQGVQVGGAVVRGCGDEVEADEDGAFVLDAPRAVPCTLHARPAEDHNGFGVGTDVLPDGPVNGLIVQLTAPLETQPGALELLEMLDGNVESLEGPDPFAMALEAEGLSPEARSLLEGWSAEHQEAARAHAARRAQFGAGDGANPFGPEEFPE